MSMRYDIWASPTFACSDENSPMIDIVLRARFDTMAPGAGSQCLSFHASTLRMSTGFPCELIKTLLISLTVGGLSQPSHH